MLPLLALYLFSAIAYQLSRGHVPAGVLALAVKAAIWLIPAALYAREPVVAAFALGPPARGGLLRAGLVGLAYLGGIVLFALAVRGGSASWSLPPAMALLLLVVNSVIEEAAFRGFLLLHLARLIRFWKANGLVGLGFAAVHVPSFLAQGMNLVEVIISCAILFVFSLALGEATRATRSIWPAVVIHSLNNLLG